MSTIPSIKSNTQPKLPKTGIGQQEPGGSKIKSGGGSIFDPNGDSEGTKNGSGSVFELPKLLDEPTKSDNVEKFFKKAVGSN